MNDPAAQVLNELPLCRTIEDFVRVYDTHGVQLMNIIRRSLTESRTDADTWAMNWAIRMRTALDGPDVELNQYRRTALKLLYELCNAWRDEKNTSVTETSIVQIFQGHRVENILSLTLPLDRAQCLYNMKYPSSNQYGMHWVSSIHVDNDPRWQDRLRTVDGLATMNKRLLWLNDVKGLQLSPDISRWLQPE